MKVFLDANVFFAAAWSPQGASAEILRQGTRGEVELITSEFVLEEVRRNIEQKRPDALPLLVELLDALDLTLVNPSRSEVERAAQYTILKDAPVVAAAKRASVDYLVSLDRRHLVNDLEVATQSGLEIILPGQLLEKLGMRPE